MSSCKSTKERLGEQNPQGVQTIDKPIFPVWGCMKGPQPLHIFAPAWAFAGPGFRFANVVCEPPAAQSAAFEIRSGGMYAARLEALWASKSPKATADGKIEDFDAAPSERPKWPLPLSFSFSPRAAFHLPGVPALRSAKALSSGLQPRKRGLRPAVTEGDKRREGISPTSDGE